MTDQNLSAAASRATTTADQSDNCAQYGADAADKAGSTDRPDSTDKPDTTGRPDATDKADTTDRAEGPSEFAVTDVPDGWPAIPSPSRQVMSGAS
jgi:hypothetical protein